MKKKYKEDKKYNRTIEHEMPQDEVAEALFLNPKTISRIENRVFTKIKLALEAKGLTADNLLPE